jgi:hypothetical protein
VAAALLARCGEFPRLRTVDTKAALDELAREGEAEIDRILPGDPELELDVLTRDGLGVGAFGAVAAVRKLPFSPLLVSPIRPAPLLRRDWFRRACSLVRV